MGSMGTAEAQRDEQASCISAKGTGMFLPRIGRDPKDSGQQLVQQQQRLKNKKLSAYRAGKSRTTAVYMPFLRPGGVLYSCSSYQQPGRLQPSALSGGPVTGPLGQLSQQQHCMVQGPGNQLGPRSSSSDRSSSSNSHSSSVLEHPTHIPAAAGPAQLSCAGPQGPTGGQFTPHVQNLQQSVQQQCLQSSGNTAGTIGSNAGTICVPQQHVLHTHAQQPAQQHWVIHSQPSGLLEPTFSPACSSTIVSNVPCAEQHSNLQQINGQQGVTHSVTHRQAAAAQQGPFLLVSSGSRAAFNKWGPIGPQQQQQQQQQQGQGTFVEHQGPPQPNIQVQCSNSSSIGTANGTSMAPGQLVYTMPQPTQLVSYSQGPNQLLQVSSAFVSPVYYLQMPDQQQQQQVQLQVAYPQPAQQQFDQQQQQQAGLQLQAQGLPPASTPAYNAASNALLGPSVPQGDQQHFTLGPSMPGTAPQLQIQGGPWLVGGASNAQLQLQPQQQLFAVVQDPAAAAAAGRHADAAIPSLLSLDASCCSSGGGTAPLGALPAQEELSETADAA